MTTPPSWKEVLGENHHFSVALAWILMVYFYPMKNPVPPSQVDRLENELKSIPSEISHYPADYLRASILATKPALVW